MQNTAQDYEKSIDASNAFYGGLDVANMDNIYFVNGVVDPWHTLGVNESVNDKSPVSVGVWSHCADMGFGNPNFPNPEQDETRVKIGKWIEGIVNDQE